MLLDPAVYLRLETRLAVVERSSVADRSKVADADMDDASWTWYWVRPE